MNEGEGKMYKSILGAVCACLAVVSFNVNASLLTIGTATYLGNDYNLIYDVEDQITWLDYSNSGATYVGTETWISSLDTALTINLIEGYSPSWGNANWRLPEVYGSGNNPTNINFIGSEMTTLYYSELGNELNDTSLNFGIFNNIISSGFYFLEPDPSWGWDPVTGSFAPYFSWTDSSIADPGELVISTNTLNSGVYGMAVISGEVSMVPVPAAVWLFGSGLLGLVGVARRKKA